RDNIVHINRARVTATDGTPHRHMCVREAEKNKSISSAHTFILSLSLSLSLPLSLPPSLSLSSSLSFSLSRFLSWFPPIPSLFLSSLHPLFILPHPMSRSVFLALSVIPLLLCHSTALSLSLSPSLSLSL